MSKTAALSIFATLTAFLITVIITASPWPADQDGVNFLFGVEFYDPVFHQPHFPGYPVYIAAGKLAVSLTGTAERGLIALSALAGVFAILLVFIFTRRSYGDTTGVVCAMLVAVNPVFFEFSHKIQTEALGLLMLMLAVVALGSPDKTSGIRSLVSGFIFGLMLGVRLSWWPYAIVYLIVSSRYGKMAQIASGLIAGTLLWSLPQIIIIGPGELLEHGMLFLDGHFNQWGGALGSMNGAERRVLSIGTRVSEAVGWSGTGINITRAPWILASVLGILYAIKNWKTFDKGAVAFLLATAVYLAWVALGQNVSKVRHFVPLIPAMIFVVAPLAKKKPQLVLLAGAFLALTIFIDNVNRPHNAPPVVRLHQWLNETHHNDTIMYCGEAERFFDRYPAIVTVKNVKHVKNLKHAVDSTWPSLSVSLLCDDIPGLRPTGQPLAEFLARPGDPVDRTIKVYALTNE